MTLPATTEDDFNSIEQLISLEAELEKWEVLRELISETASAVNNIEPLGDIENDNRQSDNEEEVEKFIAMIKSGAVPEAMMQQMLEYVNGVAGEIARGKKRSREYARKLETLLQMIKDIAERQKISLEKRQDKNQNRFLTQNETGKRQAQLNTEVMNIRQQQQILQKMLEQNRKSIEVLIKSRVQIEQNLRSLQTMQQTAQNREAIARLAVMQRQVEKSIAQLQQQQMQINNILKKRSLLTMARLNEIQSIGSRSVEMSRELAQKLGQRLAAVNEQLRLSQISQRSQINQTNISEMQRQAAKLPTDAARLQNAKESARLALEAQRNHQQKQTEKIGSKIRGENQLRQPIAQKPEQLVKPTERPVLVRNTNIPEIQTKPVIAPKTLELKELKIDIKPEIKLPEKIDLKPKEHEQIKVPEKPETPAKSKEPEQKIEEKDKLEKPLEKKLDEKSSKEELEKEEKKRPPCPPGCGGCPLLSIAQNAAGNAARKLASGQPLTDAEKWGLQHKVRIEANIKKAEDPNHKISAPKESETSLIPANEAEIVRAA